MADKLVVKLVGDLGIPECTECESRCAVLKKRREVRTEKVLDLGNVKSKQFLIDVGEIVPDWSLIDASFRARVTSGKKSIADSEVSVEISSWSL